MADAGAEVVQPVVVHLEGYTTNSASIETKTDIYGSLNAYFDNEGGTENFCIMMFDDEVSANNFYDVLMGNRHHCIGVAVPVFRVVGDDQHHFLALAKKGETLDLFLRRSENQALLCDCLKNVVQGDYKQFSEEYKKILRDLIDVHLHLKDSDLVCSLDLETVSISWLKQQVTISKLQYRDKVDQAEKNKQWSDLVEFIKLMNREAKIDTVSILEMKNLSAVLTSGDDIDETIFDNLFFWNSIKRCDFICKLHSYLEANRGVVFHNATIVAKLGDWEETVNKYEPLMLLKRQDTKDREKYSVKGRRTQSTSVEKQEEEVIRMLIDFMRQTLHHFSRMKRFILDQKNQCSISTKLELQLLYECVFPNHIQLLAARAEELKIIV